VPSQYKPVPAAAQAEQDENNKAYRKHSNFPCNSGQRLESDATPTSQFKKREEIIFKLKI